MLIKKDGVYRSINKNKFAAYKAKGYKYVKDEAIDVEAVDDINNTPKNPEELTIAQIKEELDKLGVKYVQDARKDELLALLKTGQG